MSAPKPGPGLNVSGGFSADGERARPLPTGPTEPSAIPRPTRFQMGEITDRDRFLDDASDRRAALMAASRVLADEDHVSHDEVAAVSAALYRHLRKGKS